MANYSMYGNKTYDELIRDLDRLEAEYNSIEESCLKDNLSFSEFCEKAHDVKEKMFYIDKYARLKQEPEITYGKEWNGHFMTIEDFKKDCTSGYYVDEDGYGFYATESSKSDVKIMPSDVLENIIRTDFPYVIWFNK